LLVAVAVVVMALVIKMERQPLLAAQVEMAAVGLQE
jgi:hypothetical protein